MDNFSFSRHAVVRDLEANCIYNDKLPVVIEGAQEYDTLCPVSKFTGMREDLTSLLVKRLDSSNQYLVSTLLQKLPEVQQDTSLTDSQRFDLLVHYCESGTPAEDALVRDRLALIADELLVSSDVKSEEDVVSESSESNLSE